MWHLPASPDCLLSALITLPLSVLCPLPQLQDLGTVQPFLEGAGVFARMSPDDKRTLMELLGDGTLGEDGSEVAGQGHHVGFCGDGANDVGALKAAHVGVSLCEAEASVAAPLTSKRQTIACMLTVIAEGRCSLITSYIIFKFIIVYAFIQASGWVGGWVDGRERALGRWVLEQMGSWHEEPQLVPGFSSPPFPACRRLGWL